MEGVLLGLGSGMGGSEMGGLKDGGLGVVVCSWSVVLEDGVDGSFYHVYKRRSGY